MILQVIKTIIKRWIKLPIRQLLKPKPKTFCKQQVPKVRYTDGSWLTVPTTPDQQRIEDYLKQQQISSKQILHIGTGNASFSKQFSSCNNIDSITIVEDEINNAISLKLPNYRCFRLNKYSNELLKLPTKYDIISDNNLSSYACCYKHFETMMCNYFSLLKPNGFIITDKKGMDYHLDFAFPITVETIKLILPEAEIVVIHETVLIKQKE
jgi:hypothetical protein